MPARVQTQVSYVDVSDKDDDNDQTLTPTLGQQYEDLCDRPVGTEQDPEYANVGYTN